MKLFILIVTCFANHFCFYGQNLTKNTKRPIDSTAIVNWPTVKNPSLSNNGLYAGYVVDNYPKGSKTLIIKSTNYSWSKEIIFSNSYPKFYFSDDSKKVFFKLRDTIYFHNLGEDNCIKVWNVSEFKVPYYQKEWIAYKLKDTKNELVLYNINNGIHHQFQNVTYFDFNDQGNLLLFKSELKSDTCNVVTLRLFNLLNNSESTIWSASSVVDRPITPMNYDFDEPGMQLIFMVQEKNNKQFDNSIWLYKVGHANSEKIIANNKFNVDSGYTISSSFLKFSKNSNNIFFESVEIEHPKTITGAAMVDIWSYKDVLLQPEQLNEYYREKRNLGIYNLKAKKTVYIQKENENVQSAPDDVKADYIVVTDDNNVHWWRREGKIKTNSFLISLLDGSRKILPTTHSNYYSFSPLGKYLVYFDGKKRNYFSYELKTGIIENITESINSRLDNEYLLYVPGRTYPTPFSIAGWLDNDSALLIYDNNDIWKVNLVGKKSPENLTNGYGKKSNIKFRLVYENVAQQGISSKDSLLLVAFNTLTKFNGFYRKRVGDFNSPRPLVMKGGLYYRDNSQIPNSDYFDKGMRPIKARDTNLWLIKYQTATESPNLFITKDFIDYSPISNINPQREYNWLSTQLITWKQFDGTYSQGILYKPEAFDPSKKYPLLINYYETFSYRLNEYPIPYFSTGRIDIPWFVSRGYLVFTPDIHYSIASISGKVVGDCAYNSIVSAVNYLSKYPFVDKSRIGIQGHSFSGGETLYLLTHSNKFAAACAAASTVSNEISAYLGIKRPKGKLMSEFRLSHAETGHDMLGATLWERPDLYLKASPVLKAHQVVTPLLIMHNLGDEACDWGQSAEMYMALRRLEKRAWMLQYDGEDHQVFDKSALDYTIRMNQFFDHYLKAGPPPLWMTKGIPAAMKGKITGYDFDPIGNCGKDCKVCVIWNEKMKKDSAGTIKEIQVKTKAENWMVGGDKQL